MGNICEVLIGVLRLVQTALAGTLQKEVKYLNRCAVRASENGSEQHGPLQTRCGLTYHDVACCLRR